MTTSFTPPRMYRCSCGKVVDHEPFDGRCPCGGGEMTEMALDECYQHIAEVFYSREAIVQWLAKHGPDQGRA